jgi:hypothetical protein
MAAGDAVMALTHDFKETIRARAQSDAKFRRELLREAAESRFANAIDRLLPPYQNLLNEGGSWGDFAVTREKADRRLSPIGEGSQALWERVRAVLDEAEGRGYFVGKG